MMVRDMMVRDSGALTHSSGHTRLLVVITANAFDVEGKTSDCGVGVCVITMNL